MDCLGVGMYYRNMKEDAPVKKPHDAMSRLEFAWLVFGMAIITPLLIGYLLFDLVRDWVIAAYDKLLGRAPLDWDDDDWRRNRGMM